MTLTPYLDWQAAIIVLGGTLLAAALRCGWSDFHATIGVLLRLGRKRFDKAAARAALAAYVQRIDRDGLLRARPDATGDREIDHAIGVLAESRSIHALASDFEDHRQNRLAASQQAGFVLGQAVELAPVLGLAGTLVSLGKLSGLAAQGGDFAVAVGSAVITTLYGLVFANFLFAPLAGAVARHSRAEDAARREIMEWLTLHAEAARPHFRRSADREDAA